jgi:Protein of unknown function with HXXEE motif
VPVETYGRWPWCAAALVGPAWALAIVGRSALARDGRWVAGLALPILLGHQTEEWVRPGGFLPFCNEQLLGSDRPDWPLTERDGFHVNVSVGWATAVAGALLWRRTPAPAAGVLWMEAGNAAMHLGMAARRQAYNPGVATAALLMAPHAIAGARQVKRSGRLSRRGGLFAAGAGIAFAGLPLAMRLRMRRARRRPAQQGPARVPGGAQRNVTSGAPGLPIR